MTARVPREVALQVGTLFDETADDLFRYACTLPNVDQACADDLVQITFREAALRWDKLAARSHEGRRQWLFTVLRNKAIDTWRQSVHLQPSSTHIIETSERVADPVNQVLCRMALRSCWSAIERMPPQRQKIAFLRWNEEWSTGEIAEWLGIDATTVRGHLKVARDQLVEQVGAEIPFLDDPQDGDSGNGLGGEATS